MKLEGKRLFFVVEGFPAEPLRAIDQNDPPALILISTNYLKS